MTTLATQVIVRSMGDLETFLNPSFTIKRGTVEHDMLFEYVKAVFEPLETTFTLVTKSTVSVKRTALDPDGRLLVTDLDVQPLSAVYELGRDLLRDTTVDLTHYLMMVAGRTLGNYLLAQGLDGDGELSVRFGDDWNVLVERVKASDPVKLEAFRVTTWVCAARERKVDEGELIFNASK